MEEKALVSDIIEDPRKRLINRVSTCLIKEPNYYESADNRVQKIVEDMTIVSESDPEFIL